MDEISKKILDKVGIDQQKEQMIPREQLLNHTLYESEIKQYIPNLKTILSSTALTSLQKDADNKQKFPLLNLVRQILHVYGFQMQPIRKSDGYTKTGIKKFKRFFLISR